MDQGPKGKPDCGICKREVPSKCGYVWPFCAARHLAECWANSLLPRIITAQDHHIPRKGISFWMSLIGPKT